MIDRVRQHEECVVMIDRVRRHEEWLDRERTAQAEWQATKLKDEQDRLHRAEEQVS